MSNREDRRSRSISDNIAYAIQALSFSEGHGRE